MENAPGCSVVIKDFVHTAGDAAQCWVCGAESSGHHFDVNACRACAAFFRRTVTLDKRYECAMRKKCPIHKDARNMCRLCRFEKCIRLGMNPSNIRLHRDVLGQRPADRLPSIPKSPPLEASALARFLDGYQRYQRYQRTLYSVFYPEHMFHPGIKWTRVKMVEFRCFWRSCQPLLLKMMREFFPEFSGMPVEQQALILDHISEAIGVLDRAFQTTCHFPELDDYRLFLHYGQYVEQDDVCRFCEDDVDPELSTSWFKHIQVRFELVVIKLKKMMFTINELSALIGIVYCREVDALSPNGKGSEILGRLMVDLSDYCQRSYGESGQSRMGSLICVLRDVELITQTITELDTANGLHSAHSRRGKDSLMDFSMSRMYD